MRADKFMQHLYRNACAYVDTKNRNRRRVEGTCKWFTNHELFKRWAVGRSDPGRGLLYVTADPGCGKSVLSRYLIDEVLPAEGRTVCYFFFKDDFEEQKSCLRAACTVLYQLFDARPHLLSDAILERFEKQEERFFESFTNLWNAFVGASTHEDTVCIFDALDECQEEDRKQVINAVMSLHGAQSNKTGGGGLKC
jgi:hypothetical protein